MSFANLVNVVNNSSMVLREIVIYAKNPSVQGSIPFCGTYKGDADIQINFVVSKNIQNPNNLIVIINLIEVDENNNMRYFDTDISIHNNDFASLRDQGQAISFALEAFYGLGFNTKFGELVGA